jgi:hypothetical protein
MLKISMSSLSWAIKSINMDYQKTLLLMQELEEKHLCLVPVDEVEHFCSCCKQLAGMFPSGGALDLKGNQYLYI